MAEDFPLIKRGAIDNAATVIDAIANGAISIWDAVILVAPPAGETLPRVATSAVIGDPLKYGVMVDFTGTAVVAGDHVSICVKGRTKVNANAAIALNAPVENAAVAGRVSTAALAVIGDIDDVLGYALTATAAAAADIFIMDVNREF